MNSAPTPAIRLNAPDQGPAALTTTGASTRRPSASARCHTGPRRSHGTPADSSRRMPSVHGTAGTSRCSIPVRWKRESTGGSASGSKPGSPRWSAHCSHMNLASHDVATVS